MKITIEVEGDVPFDDVDVRGIVDEVRARVIDRLVQGITGSMRLTTSRELLATAMDEAAGRLVDDAITRRLDEALRDAPAQQFGFKDDAERDGWIGRNLSARLGRSVDLAPRGR